MNVDGGCGRSRLRAVVLWSASVFGEMIHTEGRVVVNRGSDVRLGNIATITGADEKTAASLADIVVMSDVESDKRVSADSVLLAISAQLGAGTVAQQLEVSGAATVEVVVGTPAPRGKPEVPIPEDRRKRALRRMKRWGWIHRSKGRRRWCWRAWRLPRMGRMRMERMG